MVFIYKTSRVIPRYCVCLFESSMSLLHLLKASQNAERADTKDIFNTMLAVIVLHLPAHLGVLKSPNLWEGYFHSITVLFRYSQAFCVQYISIRLCLLQLPTKSNICFSFSDSDSDFVCQTFLILYILLDLFQNFKSWEP